MSEFLQEKSFGVIPCKKEGNSELVFLVQHKNGGHWGFPKGHKEKNETDKEAAFRELYEETGLKEKRLLQENPFSESYSFFKEEGKIHKKVFYFLAEVKGSFSIQREEILQGKWFSIKKAREVLTFLESRALLDKVAFFLEKNPL